LLRLGGGIQYGHSVLLRTFYAADYAALQHISRIRNLVFLSRGMMKNNGAENHPHQEV
jgi:hypothetical protein